MRKANSVAIAWLWIGQIRYRVRRTPYRTGIAEISSIGTLLQGSDWTSAICEANVASSGTAESFLTASSITRTRQAHQITACSLHNLMKTAYQDCCTDEPGSPPLGLEDWCVQQRRASPQFQFLNLVLKMELAIFTLIRSFRQGNFELCRYARYAMIPYFFANDNVNYARLIPIHLRDIKVLEDHWALKTGVFNKDGRVHSSSSWIWC